MPRSGSSDPARVAAGMLPSVTSRINRFQSRVRTAWTYDCQRQHTDLIDLRLRLDRCYVAPTDRCRRVPNGTSEWAASAWMPASSTRCGGMSPWRRVRSPAPFTAVQRADGCSPSPSSCRPQVSGRRSSTHCASFHPAGTIRQVRGGSVCLDRLIPARSGGPRRR